MELIAYPDTAPPLIDQCQLAGDELIINERDHQISHYARGLINSEELIGRYGANVALERIQAPLKLRSYEWGPYWKNDLLLDVFAAVLLTVFAGQMLGVGALLFTGTITIYLFAKVARFSIEETRMHEDPILLQNIRAGLGNIDKLSALDLGEANIEGLSSYKERAQSVFGQKDALGVSLKEAIQKEWNLEGPSLALAEPL